MEACDNRASKNNAKILWWVIGALWAVSWFFTTTAYSELKVDVKENTQGRIEMARDMQYVKQSVDEIKLGLNQLLGKNTPFSAANN